MAHPPRYLDGDPILARVRQIALALPGASEKLSHGCPTWFTTKTFLTWHAHLEGDHYSTRLARAIVFLPDADEHDALLEDPRFHVPAYVGHRGWVALDLVHHLGEPARTTIRPSDADAIDWDEVTELIDASYRNTAPAKLIGQLDSTA